MDRRTLITAALSALAGLPLAPTSNSSADATDQTTTMTLEAFADTLLPGAKRFSGDAAVAGAAGPPGGADVGYLDLLCHPLVGLGPMLPGVAAALNARAIWYAATHLILLPLRVPSFVGLTFPHRTAVVDDLLRGQDRIVWTLMALLASAAFDSAAHRHTAEAVLNRHPGMTFVRFPLPGSDGLWRFPDYSYRRQLSDTHPRTTVAGNPL
ncbi:DUF5987 family protein [Actinokineospora sp. HUAS TT18]|uniref:DUF5987 family protein n=1 Tax=Actinokineospora sp. HUAS TT18 TaxID=3447451 RepID=UPI003F51D43C